MAMSPNDRFQFAAATINDGVQLGYLNSWSTRYSDELKEMVGRAPFGRVEEMVGQFHGVQPT